MHKQGELSFDSKDRGSDTPYHKLHSLHLPEELKIANRGDAKSVIFSSCHASHAHVIFPTLLIWGLKAEPIWHVHK